MSDDIVARLRQWAPCWTDSDQISIDPRTAADEIERPRRNPACAPHQRSTQFCAEAVDAQRGFETLQAQLGKNAIALAATLRELRKVETECSMLRVECGILERNAETTYENHKRIVAELTAERDEARREVCRNEVHHLPTMADPCREAKRRGWDCFKEERNA